MELRAERKLNDGVAAMLEQFSSLLLCARVRGPVEQQADELSAAVLSAGLLHSADGLMQLAEELSFDALLSDGGAIGAEARALAERERAAAAEGDRRLEAVRLEMQAGLRELEQSYYNSRRLLPSEADAAE